MFTDEGGCVGSSKLLPGSPEGLVGFPDDVSFFPLYSMHSTWKNLVSEIFFQIAYMYKLKYIYTDLQYFG